MRRVNKFILAALGLCVAGPNLYAHGSKPSSFYELRRAWELDWGTLLLLLLLVGLYARGLAKLRRAMPSGSIARWELYSFVGGFLSLLIALVSPLHPWGRVLFSAHMAQHEILMLVAAPLLVLGRTFLVTLKALPVSWIRAIMALTRSDLLQGPIKAICNPAGAWLLHGLTLWIWHVPALFQATIDNDFVHALQHLSFFLTALLFWWAVIHGPHKRMGYGMSVLYMFTTALHSGVLGALLTFTTSLWYPVYNDSTRIWGLTPLEDQELGGLIMWIPAGLIYIGAALVFFAAWLNDSEKRSFRAGTGASIHNLQQAATIPPVAPFE